MQRLLDAARALDSTAVAAVVHALAAERGVADAWEEVCAPALRQVSYRGEPLDIAVEHTLADGIARGLDRAVEAHAGDCHVLLACAPREAHALPLRALAAALAERRVGASQLGAAVPWAALRAAVRRTAPRTAVVWAQTDATADVDALLAAAAAYPDTRFSAAGPGWGGRRLPPGITHLTSIGMAVTACTPVPATLDMEA
ncbi:transcriptional regulator [Dactylosporangium sp. AC04546]|uniref:transcriptional regulator n=1 Tax=Dactylosporangium sp. AC04546 TaxID=2862460 RepID=UPI001EE0EE1B|nr:transcriptional regulator [Dactylosporangium sp. AC04546]WVK82871.1 transcriptional regulator [Dactylosporangium sp. AC04546]